MNKAILVSLCAISLVGAVAVGGTIAYFTDTETSAGNTFTAGTLNLKVGDSDPTTWNFIISDIKPGDSGVATTTIYNIGSIDGYLHLTFDGLLDEENVYIEPEEETANQNQQACEDEGGVWDAGSETCDLSGDSSGELAENLDLLIYIDEDSDETFLLGADTLVYQGKLKGILQGDEFNYVLESGGQRDFRIEWELGLSIGNIVQSDKAGFDILFELTQTQKDIVGDWHFNEDGGLTAYDSSGRGNNGILNGATWGDGKYNPAMDFGGATDYRYVDIGSNPLFDADKTTIEAWFNPGSYATGIGEDEARTIIWNGDGTGGHDPYWVLINVDGYLEARVDYETPYQHKVITSDSALNLDTWHHFALSIGATETKLYVDGALQSEIITGAGSACKGTNYIAIGRSMWHWNAFDGIIDEVKIYSRVLDNSEILAHYQAGE